MKQLTKPMTTLYNLLSTILAIAKYETKPRLNEIGTIISEAQYHMKIYIVELIHKIHIGFIKFTLKSENAALFSKQLTHSTMLQCHAIATALETKFLT